MAHIIGLSDDAYISGCLLLRECARGDFESVKKRLEFYPSLLEFKDYDHRTPLHVCASEGYENIVSMLLHMGADPTQTDRWGGSPLDDAQRSNMPKVVALLREYGAREGVMDHGIELSLACARGNVDRIRSLVEEGADVSCRDYDQRSPLHLAAGEGHTAVCSLLLELGAAVNLVDRWGRTPLDDAIRKDHKACAEVLVKAGGTANGQHGAPEKPAPVAPTTSTGVQYAAAAMEVDWADVKVLEKIGMGAFGEIFKCRWRGSLVAAKRMKVPDLATPEKHKEAVDDFRQEIEIVLHMRHPNICLLLGYSLTEQHEVMISELMKCSLQDVMKATAGTPLPLEKVLRYGIQFAQGMAYLHTSKPPVLHRDLKPANILLDFSDTIKVFTSQPVKCVPPGLTYLLPSALLHLLISLHT